MSFSIRHRGGEMERDPALSRLPDLLHELEGSLDPEHDDVAVKHESEWTLTLTSAGRLIWENVEEGEPQHMETVSSELALELMTALAGGGIGQVQANLWLPGY